MDSAKRFENQGAHQILWTLGGEPLVRFAMCREKMLDWALDVDS